MKRKWRDLPQADKFMLLVRLVTSILVVVLAALQLLGVWDKAINIAVPLMGVFLLIPISPGVENAARCSHIWTVCGFVYLMLCHYRVVLLKRYVLV